MLLASARATYFGRPQPKNVPTVGSVVQRVRQVNRFGVEDYIYYDCAGKPIPEECVEVRDGVSGQQFFLIGHPPRPWSAARPGDDVRERREESARAAKSAEREMRQQIRAASAKTVSTTLGERMQGAGGGVLLDGFMMLDVCHVEDPAHLVRAKVAGQHITDIEMRDMALFTNVDFLDVSDNRIPFEHAASFPDLRTLEMECNRITDLNVPQKSFLKLASVNLAYNALTPAAVASLADLPALRSLDLTGNEMADLPADLSGFKALECLILADNDFADSRILLAIATMPKLQTLDLAGNQLTFWPDIASGFSRLERLSLARNRIAFEEDVVQVVQLPKLREVLLWGNPVVAKHVGCPPKLASLADRRHIAVALQEPATKKKRGGPVSFDRDNMKRIDAGDQWTARNKRAMVRKRVERTKHEEFLRSLTPGTKQRVREAHSPPKVEGAEPQGPPDSVFLTQVDVVEDVVEGRRDITSPASDLEHYNLQDSFRRLVTPTKPTGDLRATMRALKYVLDHPVTYTGRLDTYQRTTFGANKMHMLGRKKRPHRLFGTSSALAEKERQQPPPRDDSPLPPLAAGLRATLRSAGAVRDRPRDSEVVRHDDPPTDLDEMLRQMKQRLAAVESNLATALANPLDARLSPRIPHGATAEEAVLGTSILSEFPSMDMSCTSCDERTE